jgi:hypothetical protein
MSGNVALLCLHILMAQIGRRRLFQFFLPINFSHNLGKDLQVILCNFLGIPLFLCLSAKIIPTKFLYEQYKHRWTRPTCIGVWTLTYFVNAQIVLYSKIATYIPKRQGNTMEILQTSTHCPSTNRQQSISYRQNNILNAALLVLHRLFCRRCPNFRILPSHFE